ncbi:MAG: helix-hairpin-helix protein [Flaviaesturariibacter sp.]|nr:helix-hairpin-helix protein [Flaviaesturariibacter sp.]
MARTNPFSDYFTFTRKDRIGAIGVLVLLSAIYFLPLLFSRSSPSVLVTPDSALLAVLDTVTNQPDDQVSRQDDHLPYQPDQRQNSTEPYTRGALFPFDPNTLPIQGWLRLGLPDRRARTILNYIAKGGRFRTPDDLKKIWGLPPGFYERVRSSIRIQGSERPAFGPFTTTPAARPARTIRHVSLNAADTTALIALPGIGSKLAGRITAFRDRLGGFYSVDQVAETYGLSDSTFQVIRPFLSADIATIKKIDINAATKEELRTHPYLRWNLANAIVEYRSRHGAFRSADDLLKIALIDSALLRKVGPYLEFR